MSEIVLDSSAVLALLNAEPGAEVVRPVIAQASLNTVNMAEVYTKLAEYGPVAAQAFARLWPQVGSIVPFTPEMADLTGKLRPFTRHKGLSLGDRACLAHGMLTGAEVYTTERVWSELVLPCKIRLIR